MSDWFWTNDSPVEAVRLEMRAVGPDGADLGTVTLEGHVRMHNIEADVDRITDEWIDAATGARISTPYRGLRRHALSFELSCDSINMQQS